MRAIHNGAVLSARGGTSLPARVIDIGVVLLSGVLVDVVAYGIHGPVRVVLATVFAFLVPGWALSGFWRGVGLSTRLPVAVGLSIAIEAIAAAGGLFVSRWEPGVTFYALVGLSVGAIAATTVIDGRKAAGDG